MGCLIFCFNQNKIRCFLRRAAITFSLVPKHCLKTCVAMETVYEINTWRYFAIDSLWMEQKSWKWFNSSAWKSCRHHESRADRRFGGELRGDRWRFQGWEAEPRGETRAENVPFIPMGGARRDFTTSELSFNLKTARLPGNGSLS